jgi:preprotein translocase subunit SecG
VFTVVVVFHVLASLFLILVVLLQSGKSGDIASAFGGGGGGQATFGPRGTSNVLTKATAIVAAVFMITSLSLVMLSQEDRSSVLDELESAPPVTSNPATDAPPPVPDAPAMDEETSVIPPETSPAGEDGGDGGVAPNPQ